MRRQSGAASHGTFSRLAWAGAERWGHEIASFAVLAVLARLLEPTPFGLVALASLCLSFFTIVVDQGVGTAIVRLPRVESKHLSSSFWVAVGISITMVIVTAAAAPFVSVSIGAAELAPVLRVLALSVPLAALAAIPAAILTRELRFDVLAKRAVAGVVVGGTAGVLAAWLGAGVWSLVIHHVTAAVIGLVVLWAYVPWRPTAEISIRHLRDVAAVAAGVVANAVAWFICQRADQAVIGAGIGPYELALYAVAMRIVMLVSEVCAPLVRVALPVLSRDHDDAAAFETSYVRLTTGAVLLGVPSIAGAALVAPDAVAVIFGPAWQQSGVVIRLLVGYAVIRVVLSMIDPAMVAKGKMALYVPLLAFHAATTVVAGVVGVAWGLEGVAIAATINTMVQGVVGGFVLHRSLGVRLGVLAKSITPLLAACGCMVIGVSLLRTLALDAAAPWVSLTSSAAAGAIVYGAAVWLLAPDVGAEIKRVARGMPAFRPVAP